MPDGSLLGPSNASATTANRTRPKTPVKDMGYCSGEVGEMAVCSSSGPVSSSRIGSLRSGRPGRTPEPPRFPPAPAVRQAVLQARRQRRVQGFGQGGRGSRSLVFPARLSRRRRRDPVLFAGRLARLLRLGRGIELAQHRFADRLARIARRGRECAGRLGCIGDILERLGEFLRRCFDRRPRAVDLIRNSPRRAPHVAHRPAQFRPELRQPVGSKHHQRDDEDEDELHRADAKDLHAYSFPAAGPSGTARSTIRSPPATAVPSTPLTKRELLSLPNILARSTASLMATFGGVTTRR